MSIQTSRYRRAKVKLNWSIEFNTMIELGVSHLKYTKPTTFSEAQVKKNLRSHLCLWIICISTVPVLIFQQFFAKPSVKAILLYVPRPFSPLFQ